MAPQRNAKEDKSLTSLFMEFAQEIRQLIRQEFDLVRTEMSEKTVQARTGIIALVAGLIFGFAGFLVLLATAVIALSYFLPAWLSALIVTIATLIASLGCLLKARSTLSPENLKPRRTSETLRQEKNFVKEQIHELAGR